MQIQKISQQPNYIQRQTSFKGVPDTVMQALLAAESAAIPALRFLDTNQAIGACAVDVGCMVIPRTATDFSRGANAGFETMFRESSGTVNHASIGPVYGALAGMLVSTAINSKYGINAKHVFADFDTLDVLSRINYDNVKAAKGVDEYVHRIAANIKSNDKQLSSEAEKEFAQTLKSIIEPPKDLDKKGLKKFVGEAKAKLRSIALADFANESKITLEAGGKKVAGNLNDVIDSISSLSKTFFSPKVKESFKNAADFAGVEFVKAMKNFSTKRTLLGLGIGAAVGCSIQPLNIYRTKKRTGSDGFVGVDGRQKDNSFGFKVLKGVAALAFATGAILSIGNPKNLLKNIQYKSLIPTLNQFKLVYVLTIASRFLSARDKDELREAAVKDTIGFASWLILGNFVAKGTLKGLSNLFKKSKGIDLGIVGKTRDEILFKALKDKGISTIENGKALGFKELLAKLPIEDTLTRTKLRYFNLAQLAGYAFSGIVLGVGVPKLNIYMTKKNDEKRKARLAELKSSTFDMLQRSENVAFMKDQLKSRHII